MKCFYHGVDLDGKCSGAIVKSRYPDTELFPINYNNDFPFSKISKDEEVFMVDFSLKPAEMRQLDQLATFHWIDHHKTAIDAVMATKYNIKGIRNVSMAGCELTWQYCYPQSTLPRAVTLLGRYDVWDKTSDLWEDEILPFQLGIKQYDTDPNDPEGIWRKLLHERFDDDTQDIDDFIDNLIQDGQVIQGYLDQTGRDRVKSLCFESTFLGRPAIFCNGVSSSNAFKGAYDKARHQLMCAFTYTSDRKWTVSIYTESDLDVSLLAKQMGGGGHRQAAGFIAKDLSFIGS